MDDKIWNGQGSTNGFSETLSLLKLGESLAFILTHLLTSLSLELNALSLINSMSFPLSLLVLAALMQKEICLGVEKNFTWNWRLPFILWF